MTDLEMTKLCAEAMGLPTLDEDYGYFDSEGSRRSYAPLYNDAHAMALFKKFSLQVSNVAEYWKVWRRGDSLFDASRHTDLNRAIVECCARMQLEKNK